MSDPGSAHWPRPTQVTMTLAAPGFSSPLPNPTPPRVEGGFLARWAAPASKDPPRGTCTRVPESCPPAGGHSHEAQDDGAGKAQEQEEGQGAQDGRDHDHAAAPPPGPRVDRRVGGGWQVAGLSLPRPCTPSPLPGTRKAAPAPHVAVPTLSGACLLSSLLTVLLHNLTG